MAVLFTQLFSGYYVGDIISYLSGNGKHGTLTTADTGRPTGSTDVPQ